MELKFTQRIADAQAIAGSNCTFMELISEIILSRYSELIPTFKNIKESANQLGLKFDVE